MTLFPEIPEEVYMWEIFTQRIVEELLGERKDPWLLRRRILVTSCPTGLMCRSLCATWETRVCFWLHSGQGLPLGLNSGIIPSNFRGTVWDAWDWTIGLASCKATMYYCSSPRHHGFLVLYRVEALSQKVFCKCDGLSYASCEVTSAVASANIHLL